LHKNNEESRVFQKIKQWLAPPVLNYRSKSDEYRAQVFKQIYAPRPQVERKTGTTG
jgi:hypothetical protein